MPKDPDRQQKRVLIAFGAAIGTILTAALETGFIEALFRLLIRALQG